jgi:hypothetical protein
MDIAVDGLTMSIYATSQRLSPLGIFDFWTPEIGCPLRQGIREAFCTARVGHLRQKGFRVAIAIGSLAPGKSRQTIARVAAQIPRPMESNGSQKKQGQQEPLVGHR